MSIDSDIKLLLGIVLAILALFSIIGFFLSKKNLSETQRKVVTNLNARTKSWWIMCFVFAIALLTGGLGSVVLFCFVSFFAFREFITLTPTKKGDHRTLFWAFFICLPLQFYLVATHWYGLFSILIPVYAFLFIPVRSALAGDSENFLERTAKIQWGLMICVYCVSHAPALLMLDITGFEGQNAKLLFFLVLVVQLSDVMQYVWGKMFGKRKVAPHISPNKTVEGLIGGILSSTLIGSLIYWATPFSLLEAAGMAFAINVMGFSGGLCMSAIKRDRGIKDFGTMIEGHGGVLDRIDSICFAAPIFFHLTRYFYT